MSRSFTVASNCTTPDATISGPTSVTSGDTFQLTAPSGASSYTWSISGPGSIVSGQGIRSISVQATATGTIRAALTASSGSCQATDTHNVSVSEAAPVIVSFTADRYTVPFIGTTWLRFTPRAHLVVDDHIEPGERPRSSYRGEPGSYHIIEGGSGSGSFEIFYYRDTAMGDDTITLTATGPGGASTATVVIK